MICAICGLLIRETRDRVATGIIRNCDVGTLLAPALLQSSRSECKKYLQMHIEDNPVLASTIFHILGLFTFQNDI